MKLKFQLDKFTEAVQTVFGKVRKVTKRGQERLETPLYTRGQSFTGAMTAAFARQINHNFRAGFRKNTRGLPLGIGPSQVRAARALKNYLSSRSDDDESVISETLINQADTVLGALKQNAQLRSKHKRPSKIARRAGMTRRSISSQSLKLDCAKHTNRLKRNRQDGRVPYVRPALAI